jgi:hypothetical protein
MKKNSVIRWRLCFIGALTILASCAFLKHQSKGQISVQVVSWPLVKKLAEPDAGLPNQKVTLLKVTDRSVIAEKFTDVYGNVLFDVPAGTYTVRGVDMGLENVTVGAGQRVKLKLVVHYDTPLQPSKRRPP